MNYTQLTKEKKVQINILLKQFTFEIKYKFIII